LSSTSTKNKAPLILVGINVLARLPFLFAGYGREEDAWGHALYARQFFETGTYEVSRLPGHPLFEVLLTLLWPLPYNYFIFNLILTVASALSVLVFYRIAQHLCIKNPLWLSLAFSFVPAFFVAGTYTIDYNLALLFVLLSFYKLLQEKYILAGIFIGIATGVRISSLGFLLPYLIILWPHLKPAIKVGIVAVITSIVAYSLPLSVYGLSVLDFHKPPFPSWANIIYKLSFGIWGLPLFFFISYLLIISLFKQKADSFKKLKLAILCIIALQLFVFIRLPFKAEFFIPAIPFVLLYIGLHITEKLHKTIAVVSVISCFFFGFDYFNSFRGGSPSLISIAFNAGNKKIFFDPVKGPALLDHFKRKNKSAYVKYVGSELRENPNYYVIAGWYWPEIMVRYPGFADRLDYYSTEKEMLPAQKQYKVFYLHEINEANAAIKGHYLADSLATELIP